jgi:hypothetical protein
VHHLILFPTAHKILQYHDKKLFSTNPSRKICSNTITNIQTSHYLCPETEQVRLTNMSTAFNVLFQRDKEFSHLYSELVLANGIMKLRFFASNLT